MLKAITRSAQLVDKRLASINQERQTKGQSNLSVANYFDHHATELDTQVSVTEDDFIHAKQEMAPSVSMDELRHYERVRDTFEGTTKRPLPDTGGVKLNGDSHAGKETHSIPRPDIAKLRQRATDDGRSEATMNGSGRSHNTQHQAHGGASDGDEDYIVRTDRLTMNNAASRPISSKGKGKGKSVDSGAPSSRVAADLDEDLYD